MGRERGSYGESSGGSDTKSVCVDLENSYDKVPRVVALCEELRDNRAGTCVMGCRCDRGVQRPARITSEPLRIRRGDDGQPDRWD